MDLGRQRQTTGAAQVCCAENPRLADPYVSLLLRERPTAAELRSFGPCFHVSRWEAERQEPVPVDSSRPINRPSGTFEFCSLVTRHCASLRAGLVTAAAPRLKDARYKFRSKGCQPSRSNGDRDAKCAKGVALHETNPSLREEGF